MICQLKLPNQRAQRTESLDTIQSNNPNQQNISQTPTPNVVNVFGEVGYVSPFKRVCKGSKSNVFVAGKQQQRAIRALVMLEQGLLAARESRGSIGRLMTARRPLRETEFQQRLTPSQRAAIAEQTVNRQALLGTMGTRLAVARQRGDMAAALAKSGGTSTAGGGATPKVGLDRMAAATTCRDSYTEGSGC